jgi:hypothetical protein
MKKLFLKLTYAFVFFAFVSVHAQRGIGTNTPNSAAILELKSSTKGFLPPRLTISEAQGIINPPEGLTFYCTDCDVKGVFFFNGTSFVGLVDGLGLDAANSSTVVLIQIGLRANTLGISSVVTIAQLNAILPLLEGVNGSYQSFYRANIDSNVSLFSEPATRDEVQSAISVVNAFQSPTTVAGQNGTVWMDRNLGASQVATTFNDAASYGYLYQGGVKIPGWVRGGGNADSDTWSEGSRGSKDPCPGGFRVPTMVELKDEADSWDDFIDFEGPMGGSLKLPAAGAHMSGDGSFVGLGAVGLYWSSTFDNDGRRYRLYFTSSIYDFFADSNDWGFSVRCIKE